MTDTMDGTDAHAPVPSTGQLITIPNVRPPARLAPITTPWTQARIEEQDTGSPDWLEVETLDLAPVDDCPDRPRARGFSTRLGTIADGQVRVVFIDADGLEKPTAPIGYQPFPEGLPVVTLADIGGAIRARTLDTAGNTLGTFTADTYPTGTDVQRWIDMAMGVALTITGATLPAAATETFREMIIARVCMRIERSLRPESTNDEDSAYRAFLDDYTDLRDRLTNAVEANEDDGSPGALRLT